MITGIYKRSIKRKIRFMINVIVFIIRASRDENIKRLFKNK